MITGEVVCFIFTIMKKKQSSNIPCTHNSIWLRLNCVRTSPRAIRGVYKQYIASSSDPNVLSTGLHVMIQMHKSSVDQDLDLAYIYHYQFVESMQKVCDRILAVKHISSTNTFINSRADPSQFLFFFIYNARESSSETLSISVSPITSVSPIQNTRKTIY